MQDPTYYCRQYNGVLLLLFGWQEGHLACTTGMSNPKVSLADFRVSGIVRNLSPSILTAIFQMNLDLPVFIEAKTAGAIGQ